MIVEPRYKPFRWWWIEDALSSEMLGWLLRQDADPIALDSRRAATNDERTWITSGPVARYFDSEETRSNFGELTGCDFSQGKTRIELCSDYADEIQLDTHIDIKEKLMTYQIYLEGDAWSGTDLYEEQDGKVRFSKEMPTAVPFLIEQLKKSTNIPTPKYVANDGFIPNQKDLW